MIIGAYPCCCCSALVSLATADVSGVRPCCCGSLPELGAAYTCEKLLIIITIKFQLLTYSRLFLLQTQLALPCQWLKIHIGYHYRRGREREREREREGEREGEREERVHVHVHSKYSIKETVNQEYNTLCKTQKIFKNSHHMLVDSV